ncbi:hypothetical protein A8F94_08245 [Bacillus sp. FJAT-27225]|nr:hypothetical protein A8F94_08245 [Bacillus sp. FJAT-27225]
MKQLKFENWIKYGRYIFLFLLIISVHLLLTSNAMYIVGVHEGEIKEQVNFLQFTILMYFAAAGTFFILSLLLSSPKLRKVNSLKAYIIGSVTAVVIFATSLAILNRVERTVFINSEWFLSLLSFLQRLY